MSSERLFERKGESIRFFDIWGSVVKSGTEWYLSNQKTKKERKTAPEDISGQIEAMIAADYKVKKGTRIHAIVIKPQTAVALFLQRVLTEDILTRAAVDDDTITLYDVPFKKDGKPRLYGVIVEKMAPRAPAIMTVDAKGRPIVSEEFHKKTEMSASAA